MQCYTELVPPTAVSHAVNLPFLSPKANNLVVAKNSLLQIFEIKSTITEVAPDGGDAGDHVSPNLDTEVADVPLQRTEHTAKMVLVAEFPLAGTVISLARIKTLNTKSRAESLLVAFRDAKLSLVEWDPETFNLNTVSIHYYENPDVPGAPWAADLKDTYNFLTADPSSRCAALKFGAHNLAILPFRQHGLAEDDYDSDIDAEQEERPSGVDGVNGGDAQKTPYLSSFVLPLTHLDPALTHPVHLAFLHEYREPTFGIVAASRATAPSLLAERKDILTYTVFTLDLEQKASTTLLSVQGLPYDIFKVVPLPLPIGGALLIGGNEIIHVSQAGKANGVAVNEFAKASSAFPLTDQSDLALKLEGCSVELLSQETGDVLIVLDDGRILTLTFTLDGRIVSGLTVQPVAQDNGGQILKCRTSCAVNLGRGRIFVGSEDTDSVMLGWTTKSSQYIRKRSQADVTDDGDSSLEDEEDADDLDDDLYNDTTPAIKKITAAQAEATPLGAYMFRIHDALPSLGPIRDVLVNSTADARRIESSKSTLGMDLLVSTGRGRAGGVTALNRDLSPTDLAKSTLESARGLWAVHAKKQPPSGLVTDIGQDTEANLASDVDYDQYLVVCKVGPNGSEETVVYEVNGNEIQESSKGELQREDASTMNVSTLAKGTRVVQVMRTEIRTYDFGELPPSQCFEDSANLLD
jgi:cleavage and polyadenylation specificity factor subunit 1